MMTSRAGIDLTAAALVGLRHAAPEARFASRSANRAGILAGRRRGLGLEIHDLRHFSDGDDLRHVDAAVSARTGELHVRTYHEEEEDTALLVADFRASMLWGSRRRLRSVAAAEALAIAGWQVAQAGGSVGLAILSDAGLDFRRPRPREAAMLEIAATLELAHARVLASAGDGEPLPLDAALERIGRLAPRGAAILLASGLDDPGADLSNVLERLRRRLRLVLLAVLDAVETEPPARELPFAGPTGEVRWGRLTGPHRDVQQVFARSGARVVPVHAGNARLFEAQAT